MAQGYFTDDSPIRRVHRERALALAGQRTLLMQAAHPAAFESFFAATGALDDPYVRLERTAIVMSTITFGSRRRADRMTAHVRRLHHEHGVDRPAWLLWVLATLADSAMLVYDRYVTPMSRDERDAYWADQRVVGRLFALEESDMPQSIEAFDAYMAGMLAGDELGLTDEARELAIDIVMRPPVPRRAWPLLELAKFHTISLLPPRLRREYGYSWDPARGLAARSGREYARRVLIPLLPRSLRYAPGRAT
jgi:uncharacterized protein (DUF2236 family)